jgi:DNA repair exonuclease SbcCD ATPase subunit
MAEKIQRTSESQIQEVRQECNRQLQQKSKEYDDYVASASSDKAQLKKEIDRLQKSLNTMENELNRIRNENKRQKLDSEINQIAKDLKDPINKLSAIMSERFNDAASESDNPRQIRKGNKAKFTAIAVGVLFGLLFGVIIMQNKYIGHYQDTIAQFEDSISNLTKRFEIPAKHQQEDIGDTLSSMDNYTPSTISQSQKASTLRIDIINASKMEHGKNYQFRIQGGDYPQDGKWYVNKQLQVGNAYTVNEAAGTNLVIEYKTRDGAPLVSREVTVE